MLPQRIAAILAVISLLVLPAVTSAADLGERLAQQGKGDQVAACNSCHQADGSGNPDAGWPRLAGMNADYMVRQLRDIAAGERENAIMKPIASGMTEKEMRAASEYYADMAPPTEAPGDAGADGVTEGKAIANRGLWRKGVPSCVSCHGPGGRGVGADFPGLAGQNARYISSQIKAWQSDKRANDPNRLMDAVAERLTDEEVAAVAAYFAAMPAHVDQD